MKNYKLETKKLVFASLFAALTFVSTYVSFPIAIGYANLGDCFVILSGLILGPYGIASAIIGSVICDLILGYAVYIPATFIIKGLMAFTVYILASKKYSLIRQILAAFLAEAIMVAGYFLYECFCMGMGMGAIASIPYNCLQGGVAIITSTVLYIILNKTKIIKRIKL
jgi:uncharacterized membrane protein